jgi:hypothetical protein
MGTAPLLPADEVALDDATVDQLIANLDPSMILVGGQALAFWMDWYGMKVTRQQISSDGDVLGSLKAARALAKQLQGTIRPVRNSAMTSLVAQVRVPRPGGKVANVDVLHKLFTVNGLKKSTEFTKRVIARSVQVKWSEGIVFRVMHPLDILESRVHNAAGLLEDKGPHVLTQAKWAIKVAKAAVLKMAKDAALSQHAQAPERRLGAAMKAIHGLAHSRAGRTLQKQHGIEVLDAIDTEALVKISPAHARQLDAVAQAKLRRADGAATPATPAHKSQAMRER